MRPSSRNEEQREETNIITTDRLVPLRRTSRHSHNHLANLPPPTKSIRLRRDEFNRRSTIKVNRTDQRFDDVTSDSLRL